MYKELIYRVLGSLWILNNLGPQPYSLIFSCMLLGTLFKELSLFYLVLTELKLLKPEVNLPHVKSVMHGFWQWEPGLCSIKASFIWVKTPDNEKTWKFAKTLAVQQIKPLTHCVN